MELYILMKTDFPFWDFLQIRKGKYSANPFEIGVLICVEDQFISITRPGGFPDMPGFLLAVLTATVRRLQFYSSLYPILGFCFNKTI
jgi:hypothetical protein